MVSNKTLLTTLLSIIIFFDMNAQTYTKYWVKFTDKNNSAYSVSSPSAFLTARSIARRANHGIAVNATDLPVNQTYINQVNATGAQVFQTSKWFNAAIVIVTNTVQLTAINSLTCVSGSNPIAKLHSSTPVNIKSEITITPSSQVQKTSNTSSYNYGPSFNQANQLGVDCMHDAGYRGQGMVIAMLDAGFNNAGTNPVFDSLRNENRILGTRDYVDGNTSVYEDNSHGAMCLSTIVGNSPGNLIGTAPKASMYLCRTEDVNSEKPIEESNWVVAAEYADSVGADIISTSLGYTGFDSPFTGHTYNDLDGKTSVMSIAATMAARKGMFVLNAAGNDGGNSWNRIGIPADADSICAVGSVNSIGVHSSFSSPGPTADGRIKPDLSSKGEGSYVCQPNGVFTGGNGTSFATPILAGAVACLWQANPTKNNMEILAALKATASQSNTPDNNYGWGIPNMCEAHNLLNMATSLDCCQPKPKSLNIAVSIFPNPTSDMLTIKSSDQITEIKITTLLGETVGFNTTKIDGINSKLTFNQSMAKGIYLIEIKTKDTVTKQKFIFE